MARKNQVTAPYSKIKEEIADLLSKEGYLGKISVNKIDKVKKTLLIDLIYEDKNPKISSIVRVSKPGRRMYARKKRIPKAMGGFGMVMISTPQGLMTDKEARKKGLGGEIICQLW